MVEQWLDQIGGIAAAIRSLGWLEFALLLEWASGVGLFGALAFVLGLVALTFGAAHLMQWTLVRKIEKSPRGDAVSWIGLESRFSIPGLVVLPLVLGRRLVQRIGRGLSSLLKNKKEGTKPTEAEQEGGDSAPPAPARKDQRHPSPEPETAEALLVPSLGPTFAIAGVVVGVSYVVLHVLDMLLSAGLGLSHGLSFWHWLLFGRSLELQWLLPVDGFPALAVMLSVLFWTTVWWWAARFVRLAYHDRLFRNLAGVDDGPRGPLFDEEGDLLPRWYRDWGVEYLVRPASPYREWSSRLLLIAVPLILVTAAELAPTPYRTPPGLFAATLVIWVSWATHLTLQGRRRLPASTPDRTESPRESGVRRRGWSDVVDELREKHQILQEEEVGTPRVARAPRFSVSLRDAGLPQIFDELMPSADGTARLTTMQATVLSRLNARRASRNATTEGEADELKVDTRARDDAVGLDQRNQIIIAQEGAGKTQLLALAAASQTLLFSRTALVVLRDGARAKRFYDRLAGDLAKTTLRWNIRVRYAEDDLARDLSDGIIPDILVCSLRDLAVKVLGRSHRPVFETFLQNLGLIAVDDVESFCGSVEMHARLTFRRLNKRCEEVMDLRLKDGATAPGFLIAGSDAMYDMATWIRNLCGVRAIEERHDLLPCTAGSEDEDDAPRPHRHRFFRLRELESETLEPLDKLDVVAACEATGVPWTYRLCGDSHRHLGRTALRTLEEPAHFVEDPMEACVVLLEGHWSDVGREIDRLSTAGTRFRSGTRTGTEDIAFITIVDPDEEMALTDFARGSTLSRFLSELPRPILRMPTGSALRSHLSSELLDGWSDVARLVDVFGEEIAGILEVLDTDGLLACDERVDVDKFRNAYEPRLFVKTVGRALATQRDDEDGSRAVFRLPPKLSDVEVRDHRFVRVLDRSTDTVLDRIPARGSSLRYYVGRIFSNANGRFVVVGRAAEHDDSAPIETLERSDIVAEPLLEDLESTCRRRIYFEDLHPESAPPFRMGEVPVRVHFEERLVVDRVEHYGHHRLGTAQCDVREQSFVEDAERRRRFGGARLRTQGVCVYPNPVVQRVESVPKLQLGAARLIAAALRMVLPSVYRGAEEDIAVALHLSDLGAIDRTSDPDELARIELACLDCFVFFDLDQGGNDAARALYRDSVTLLFRLARVVIERVLDHHRLRTRFDTWAHESEMARPGVVGASSAPEASHRRWKHMEMVRHAALEWLDSRLAAEGTRASVGKIAKSRVWMEQGEGDEFDVGRCWYSESGSVADLLWAKHRWVLADDSEAAIDVGFDRRTAARGRLLEKQAEAVSEIRARMVELVGESSSKPTPVHHGLRRGGTPARTDATLVDHPEASELQIVLCCLAAEAWNPLAPTAALLRQGLERTQERLNDAGAVSELRNYVIRFVQAIPHGQIEKRSDGIGTPVSTLLERRGSDLAKSLLLAVLLRRAGIDTGLFIHPPTHRTFLGVQVDGVLSTTGSSDPARLPHVLDRWRQDEGLPDLPALAAVVSAETKDGPSRLFLPVETRTFAPVGHVEVDDAARFVFVPLTPAWDYVGTGDDLDDTTKAEQPGGESDG